MHSKMAKPSYDIRRQPIETRLWQADQPCKRIYGCTKGFIRDFSDNRDTDTVQVFSQGVTSRLFLAVAQNLTERKKEPEVPENH